MFEWEKLTATVANSGIVGFVGANGAGKSLAMVHSALPAIEAGRIVLSTVRIVDYQDPRPCEDDSCMSITHGHPDHLAAHPLWRPLRSWGDVLSAEGCHILFDEITGVASSRGAMSLPAPVANLLVQLRRRDIVMRWSAPAWARADSIIRETTQLAVVCSGFVRRKMPGRSWPSATIFKARAIDAREMDDLTAGTIQRVKPLRVGWAGINRLEGRHAYETLDGVFALPTIEGGRCAVCAGRRSVPACKCVDHGTLDTVGAVA